MRTRTTFQKRQKEIARAEKQRDKIARRQQKKLMSNQPTASAGGPDDLNPDELNDVTDTGSEPAGGSESKP